MSTTIQQSVVLESGDRLTRGEFHRRYCAMPDITRAELIRGVVYVSSPVRASVHGRPHALIIMWLSVFAARTSGVDVLDNATVFLDADSEVQPDACLLRIPPVGDEARLTAAGYIAGAPPLVVEVAASSASYDLHDKLDAYRRAGVQEYIAWRVLDGAIDWLRLRGDAYARLQPDARGVITSEVFAGLRLNVAALLAGDRATVLAELQHSNP